MNCSRKSNVRRNASLRGSGRENGKGTQAATPASMTSQENRQGCFGPIVSHVRIIGLAALVLAIVSPHASADIILKNRRSTLNGFARAGSDADIPLEQVQVDFLPADFSFSATASAGGASANGHGNLHSGITLETVAGTRRLTLTGNNTGSGHAVRAGAQEAFGESRALIINLTFEVTSESTYTLTGQLSGTSTAAGGFSSAGASLLKTTSPITTVFSVDADSLGGVSYNQPLSQSGTLGPGIYQFGVAGNYVTTANASCQCDVGDASGSSNFTFTVQSGTPTPTPRPGIQWNNPAGGSFHTAANWDPQMVPGANDTAIFGLQVVYSVDVGAATTERLEIRNGDLTLTNASYTVAATAFDPAGILLDNSILTLEGGLFGVHALIGESAAARVDVGSSATLSLSGSLRIGGSGNGILDISDGGLVFSGEGRIGNGVGGGTANITGSGSVTGWNSGNLSVGYSGNGILTISDGATVSSGVGFVGFGTGTTGSVTIQGSGPDVLAQGSIWNLSDGLTIGLDGAGTVQVLNFGVLEAHGPTTVNGTLVVANGALSSHNSQPVTIGRAHQGDVTVSGFAPPPNSLPGRINAISNLTAGESAAGHLIVQDGGFVSCANAILAVGAFGSAVVQGFNHDPSELSVSSQLTVGKSDLGNLILNDGGQVTADDITAGSQAGGFGILEVRGRSTAGSSSLSAEGNIVLGLEGKGALYVEEDAVVTCAGAALGVFAGAEGGAILGIDGESGAPARWIVNGDMMLGGPGIGTVVLHNGANVAVSNTLFILTNGSIGGTGTYSAQMVQNGSTSPRAYPAQTVPDGGTVAPGDPIGMMVIDGNYTQTASGRALMELAGPGPGQFDVLHVTGDSILDGTMEIHTPGNFLPATGQTFDLLQLDGSVSGSFSQIAFPDLTPGFQFNTEMNGHLFRITALNNAVAANSLLNISTRAQIGTGDNLLIAGFIIHGNEPKQVILRAIGGSLQGGGQPLPGRLTNPNLELRGSAGGLIFSNDDWMESPQRQQIIDTGIPPTDDLESAIVVTLSPGPYTAIVGGVDGATGIGLVEVYDLAHDASANMINISTRGRVQTGDEVMIAGFIASGTTRIITRVLGPSLTSQGVAGALADPTLEVVDGNGATLQANDNWMDSQQEEITATTIPPPDDLEAAAVLTLSSGPYTIIVRGVNETSGVGLVEVYKL